MHDDSTRPVRPFTGEEAEALFGRACNLKSAELVETMLYALGGLHSWGKGLDEAAVSNLAYLGKAAFLAIADRWIPPDPVRAAFSSLYESDDDWRAFLDEHPELGA